MTDSELPTPDTAAGKRRRRLLLRKRLYQRLWGGRAAHETPLVVFLAGTPEIANGYIVNALEKNFHTDLYRAGDPKAFEDQRLCSDDVLRRLIGKSRAPSVVFVAGGESDAIASLIERFSPARVLWFYDPVERFIARAPRLLNEMAMRQFIAGWAEQGERRPPDSLAAMAGDRELNAVSVWALTWYAIHDAYRQQRLIRRSAAHLISEQHLIAAPRPTLDGIFEIMGIGSAGHRRASRIRGKRRRGRAPALPEAVRTACEELQDWLDAHAERPADLS